MPVPTTHVTLEPSRRGSDYLIAGLEDPHRVGLNITDVQYHAARKPLMEMHRADPATAQLYDKFLKEVVAKNVKWPTAELEKLSAGLEKYKVPMSDPLTHVVGTDLMRHRWDPNYSPPVAVNVNGHHMHPDVVRENITRITNGQIDTIDVPRSTSPGKVSGTMAIPVEAVKPVYENAIKANPAVFKAQGTTANAASVSAQLAEAFKGKLGRNAFVSLIGVGVVGVASAAEPGATPQKVVGDMANAGVPGLAGARKGDICETIGEITGIATGGVAATATAAVAVPAATAATAGTGGLAAPLAATGATLAVGGAAIAGYQAGEQAGTAACKATVSGVDWAQKQMNKLLQP